MTPTVIQIIEETTTVQVVEDVVHVISVAEQGPQGPQGPAGPPGSGAAVVFTQGSVSALWTIAHNLGERPGVFVFTQGGVPISALITHLSEDVLTVAVNPPIAGFARLI